MDIRLKNAAIRVLSEQRESRALKASHMRKNFGDRITKSLTAEVEQMELEVEAITATIKLVEQ